MRESLGRLAGAGEASPEAGPLRLGITLDDIGTLLALGLAVAVYYFPAGIWAAVVGGAAFAVLAWRRLDLALLTTVFVIPFYRFPRPFGDAAFSLSEFAVLTTFAVWCARQVTAWAKREATAGAIFRPLYQHWSASLFLIAATLSLFFTDQEYVRYALREYRTVVAEPWLFFLMLVTTLRGRRDALRLITAFVLLGAGVAAFSLYHYFFVRVVEATEGVSRMLAVYHSPNALALFLGRALPMALVLFVFLKPQAGERWVRGVYGLAVVLSSAAIFFTYSRGAWAGVAASILFVAALRGRRLFIGAIAAVGVAGAAVLSLVNLGRLVSEGTTTLRLSLWHSALNMIRDRPVFGVGLDNFLYYYRDRGYRLPEAWREPEMSHAHNLVLDYWTRIGILGLASLVALQATFWSAAVTSYRRIGDCSAQALLLALMASMVDFVVHGLIDNSYFLIDLAMVFWLTVAAVELVRGDA